MITDAPSANRIVTPWRIACLLTLLVSGIVYLPSMDGLPVWDDHLLIGGSGVGAGNSLSACFTQPFLLHYFRPLVSITFLVERGLFGSNSFFYHQTNLLIHVLTTLACLLLFRAAFQCRVIAVAGSLLFALQPAQVSTVAWIGGRTDSLCTLWATLFAWTLIRAAQTRDGQRASWTGISTILFALALLTKEQSLCLLPLVPLAFRCFSPAPTRYAWADGMRHSTPYLLTSVGFVAAWCAFAPSPFRPVAHSVAAQAALAGRTITCYAALLALPTPGSMYLFSVATLERWGVWSIISGYAALAGLIALCVGSIRRCPARAWFAAFLLAGLLPVSNIVPLPSLVVAPYRIGLCGPAAAALLGFFVAYGYRRALSAVRWTSADAGSALADFQGSRAGVLLARANAFWTPPRRAKSRLAAGAVMLVWCAGLTWWGAGCWQDDATLFATIVQYDPDSVIARYNLTGALLKQHHTEKAIEQLDEALTRLFRSRDWMRQGPALAALQRDPEIMTRILENQGAAIRPETWLAGLYGDLGFAMLNSGNRNAARQDFLIGEAIDPSDDDVNLGLAQIAYDSGQYTSAVRRLRLVLAQRPRRAEAHMLLGHSLAALGRWSAARTELETWAMLQPWSGQAHVEVAQAKSRLGDYTGAQASLQYALSHAICDVQEVRARLRDVHGRAGQFLN